MNINERLVFINKEADIFEKEINEKIQSIPEWEIITEDDIKKIIKGTVLGDIYKSISNICEPQLPFSLNFAKAIVIMGNAFCQEITYTQFGEKSLLQSIPDIKRCKFYIDTMGGQPMMFYVLQAASSGVGKDVGRILFRIGVRNNPTNQKGSKNYIGGVASEEGLYDMLITNPNPIVYIGEFRECLDGRSYKAKILHAFTDIFSNYCFDKPLSTNRAPRKSEYCVPSVVANIPPDILNKEADKSLLADGSLNRFLFFPSDELVMWQESEYWSVDDAVNEIDEIYSKISKIEGKCTPPRNYAQNIMSYFLKYKAPYPNYWQRLSREYLPRIACLLATDINNYKVSPKLEHYNNAEKICLWLYRNLLNIAGNIEMNKGAREEEEQDEYFLSVIQKLGGCSSHTEVLRVGRRYPRSISTATLIRLEDDGRIESFKENRKKIYKLI